MKLLVVDVIGIMALCRGFHPYAGDFMYEVKPLVAL